MHSRSAGAFDFETATDDADPASLVWTAAALPSVLSLTSFAPGLGDPSFRLPAGSLAPLPAVRGESVVRLADTILRLAVHEAPDGAPALLVPLDRLFDIRAQAALRLWRALIGRDPGPNPAILSPARRTRLILALRALDGRLDRAGYRQIAEALFSLGPLSGGAWKTHDVRDRTIRLVRYGKDMMEGGYRRLLLHPYRSRL